MLQSARTGTVRDARRLSPKATLARRLYCASELLAERVELPPSACLLRCVRPTFPRSHVDLPPAAHAQLRWSPSTFAESSTVVDLSSTVHLPPAAHARRRGHCGPHLTSSSSLYFVSSSRTFVLRVAGEVANESDPWRWAAQLVPRDRGSPYTNPVRRIAYTSSRRTPTFTGHCGPAQTSPIG